MFVLVQRKIKEVRLVFVLCGVALLTSCGKPSTIAPLADSAVIVAFGDSLTYGTGADRPESYPAVLAANTGYRVINSGVPGEVTAEGLLRLPSVLAAESPDLVILCHGGNDMLRKQNTTGTINNLNEMIAMAKGAGADVILLGVPKAGLLLKPAPFYEEIAEQQKVPYDAKTLSNILSKSSLKSDQIHPNAAGYRQLAEAVQKIIDNNQRK